MIYFCCDERRRNSVRGSALNGIDFLEVIDDPAAPDEERQRELKVYFLNPLAGAALGPDNLRIEGGERVRNVKVVSVAAGAGTEAHILTVKVDQRGDFSPYTLRLVTGPLNEQPPAGFDPQLAAIVFSFKAGCDTEFDCKPRRVCPPEPRPEPEIDYLAKDYASFRRLLLDRLAVLMPQWQERSPADLGVALVELLAYVGDYLSYQQDAVATEAYLGTARRRVSMRRHARLVDYFMHDGCNARAWVQVQVSADVVKAPGEDTSPLPRGTPLCTRIPGQPALLPDDIAVLRRAQIVFETMVDVDELYAAHNELPFYTWGDAECCLPRGATRATLKGHFPNLKAGDVLIFEEVRGPHTGRPEDADPARRHAVRLTKVVCLESGAPLLDPLNAQPITEIEWAAEDALPFPLCVSSRTDVEHGLQQIEDVSFARGNIVLADHGLKVRDEPLGRVPRPQLFRPATTGADRCRDVPPVPVLPRFRPRLREGPLTQAAPYDPKASATAAMRWALRDVLPQIELHIEPEPNPDPWSPKRDLLNSRSKDKHFVAEVESDGTVTLRFGDDQLGKRPKRATAFTATYRVGNGTAGNVGAEALAHIHIDLPISKVRNPLPAQGGVEPESIEDVRQRAPSAFRTQERAVTADDYAAVTERHAEVQRAAATFRWTGSWHTVFLTVDRLGGRPVDADFEAQIRGHVERFRMAGHDLEVDAPRFVSLEVAMHVCAKPDYFRSDVKAALLEVFSSRVLPDGRRGVFHPDEFTFGQSVYLSRLYAAAQAVPGVDSVHITTFQRQGQDDPTALAEGVLPLGRLEIARLDNDPNFPEHGEFHLDVGGGK
jgi:hypothetical protein